MNIRNAQLYIENYLYIKTKSGELAKLELNAPQKKLYDAVKKLHEEGKPIRIIILKARQMGFSTLAEALIFHRTATAKNINSLIMAHKSKSSSTLYDAVKLFCEKLPAPMRPMIKRTNENAIEFANPAPLNGEGGLHSKIHVTTAGGSGVGRSETNQNVHLSEFAFWPGNKQETLTGLLQSVPALPDTMVIIESTANGFDEFKDQWDKAVNGESDFTPLFFAWHEMPDYRKPYHDEELTPEEVALREQYNLDNEQLMWRRWCIKNNCAGDVKTFKQEYPACPEEAFQASGSGIFDNEAVIRRKQALEPPLVRGEFTYKYDGLAVTDIKFNECPDGCITIYAHPEKRVPYVLGGDTAGEGSDWFTGHVLDNVTGKQVACLHRKFDEAEYARQIYCLGLHYNTALVGIETNFSSFPVKELQRLSYPKMFVRVREDQYTHRPTESYGVNTNSVTRPVIIAGLVEAAKDEGIDRINDAGTLDEMLTFARNEHGKPEAMAGYHDDLVMGLGIAYYIRPQQRMTLLPENPDIEWTEGMLSDYRNASPELKKELRKMWGTPRSTRNKKRGVL